MTHLYKTGVVGVQSVNRNIEILGEGLDSHWHLANYEEVLQKANIRRYIEILIGPHFRKANGILKGIFIHSRHSIKATTWSVSVAPWLLKTEKPIHSSIQAS